jgi:hypothetical protein
MVRAVNFIRGHAISDGLFPAGAAHSVHLSLLKRDGFAMAKFLFLKCVKI